MDRLPLDEFIRRRAAKRGLSLAALCRRAGVSRQTLYDLSLVPQKLPSLGTLIALADALEVHPLRLMQSVFDAVPMRARTRHAVGTDRSAFVADLNFPDGQTAYPGELIEKAWEIENAGEVAWEGRFLQCMDDDLVVYSGRGLELSIAPLLVPEEPRIPVPWTAPGERVPLRVRLRVPDTVGAALSYWKMATADGELCFPEAVGLSVKVRILAPESCAGATPLRARVVPPA